MPPRQETSVARARTAHVPAAAPVPDLAPENRTPRWAVGVAIGAGVMFLIGSLVNAAVTLVAPGAYADLDEWMASPEPLARLWDATMGANPRLWVPLVGVGFELGVGLLCLTRERRSRALGLAGGAAFHAGLLAMGLVLWALPLLVLFGWAALVTWRVRVRPAPSSGEDDRRDVASNGD